MLGLVLLCSLLLMIIVVLGPVSYLLSSFSWMPTLIKYLLALICIFIGAWWFLMPIPAIRYFGLIDIYIGIKIISDCSKNKL